jgi:hypothetical protein
MSVLSRRLGGLAGGFSFATVAFFGIGLYTAANTKSPLVYLFAGLVPMCLFASFFLWLAHGFAWAMIPEKTAEAKKPGEALKPVEELKPAEALKPTEAIKPAEALKPTEALKPADTLKPAEAPKPAEAIKPTEAKKPVEERKPAEEKVIAAEEDPPDAKYNIAGRRIN